MSLNFTKVENWSFNENEEKASEKICKLRDQVRVQLPK